MGKQYERGANGAPDGVSTRLNGRHAFIHEQVLLLVAHETREHGHVTFNKTQMAERLGCCVRTLDRALTRLRRNGFVVSTPVFAESGAQLGNEYRATENGLSRAEELDALRTESEMGE